MDGLSCCKARVGAEVCNNGFKLGGSGEEERTFKPEVPLTIAALLCGFQVSSLHFV